MNRIDLHADSKIATVRANGRKVWHNSADGYPPTIIVTAGKYAGGWFFVVEKVSRFQILTSEWFATREEAEEAGRAAGEAVWMGKAPAMTY